MQTWLPTLSNKRCNLNCFALSFVPLKATETGTVYTGAARHRTTHEAKRLSLFARSVGNLQTARALASDNNFAMLRAQFDLPNMTARGIDLLRNQSRAHQAVACSAPRNIAASVNTDFYRRRIEIGLQHTR